MKHFNFKSLGFYGGAIVGVVVLFQAVTTYGEANLKAPASIDGRYRLSYNQNLPNCAKSDTPVLTIEQSGIYLNGFLLPANVDTKQEKGGKQKPSLTGQISNQQLSLIGTVSSSTLCNKPVSQAESTSSSVRIQSQVEGENLSGKITLSGIPEAIGFTAQREAPVQPSESTSH